MRRTLPALVLALAACGDDGTTPPDDLPPTQNTARDVAHTALAVDLAAHAGVATVTFGAGDLGASLEVGDLDVRGVTRDGEPVQFAVVDRRLDLGVAAAETTVAISYGWQFHEDGDGVDMDGFTLTWPYYCGNVFPCRSNPADGTTFALEVTGVASGTAVYPATIPDQAPSYMAAWVVGDYQRTVLGTTTAGTTVVSWTTPSEAPIAAMGTAHLVDAFDWLEENLGPYRFGTEVGSVSAHWGENGFGGMEHHPLWHVGSVALADESTHIHEAAHGWFGDGIRLACWEDFGLSEGAATYYEARVVEEVGAPGAGAAAWDALEAELTGGGNARVVRPPGCGTVDVLTIFTRAPYVRGALWLRAIERRITRPMFDLAMRTFYQRFGGKAAGITDLVAVFREVSGYDATACTTTWLEQTPLPTVYTCP